MNKRAVLIAHAPDEEELCLALEALICNSFYGKIEIIKVKTGLSSNSEESLTLSQDVFKRCGLIVAFCDKSSVQNHSLSFIAGAAWLSDTPVALILHSGIKKEELPQPLGSFYSCQAKDIIGIKRALLGLVHETGFEVPQYEFIDFARKVKDYEKNHDFWSLCNRYFTYFDIDLLKKLRPGDSVKIKVSENDLSLLENIIRFLALNKIINYRKIGEASLTSRGWLYDCEIIAMDNLQEILSDPRFIYASSITAA